MSWRKRHLTRDGVTTFNSTQKTMPPPSAPLMRAIELDPEYGRAHAALAMVYHRAADYGWHPDLGMKLYEAVSRAHAHVEIAKSYPTALYFVARAWEALWNGYGESALSDAGRAISSDPNDPEAHIAMAWGLIVSGRPKEALNF